jgi:hypothetical protein
MNSNLQSYNFIKVQYGETLILANGDSAQKVANGVLLMFTLFGIAALIKAS